MKKPAPFRSLLDPRSFSVAGGVGGLFLLLFTICFLSFTSITSRPAHAQTTTNCHQAGCCDDGLAMQICEVIENGNVIDVTYSCSIQDDTCNPRSLLYPPTYNDIQEIVGRFAFLIGSSSTPQPPGTVISLLLPWLFALAGLLLLAYLLYGGFQILTSLGRPKAIAGGTHTILNALLGFLLLFLSYWLTQIIEIIFAVNII